MHETVKILIPIIIAHLFVLVAIVVIIKRLLLGDTMRAMSRIAEVEAEVRKKEEAIRREIEEHEKEFARRKTEAEEELQKKREESEKEVARTRDSVLGEARKEAERLVETARRNEEKVRAQVLLEMEEKAVDYAAQIFRLVFSEKMSSAMNRSFIDELLDALDQIDATSITVDAGSAEFTTSHAIESEQKVRLQSLLKSKFDIDAAIEEKVNAEIIGGMIMKLGSLEIDGSLRTRLLEAAAEVKKTANH